jgi:ribosomal protein L20
MLSELAITDTAVFDKIVEKVRPHVVTLKPKTAAK